jgi:hypothetical protein
MPTWSCQDGSQFTDRDTPRSLYANSFVDISKPLSFSYQHPVLQIGLIDEVQARLLQEPIQAALDAVEREDWIEGLLARSEMFDMLATFTGGINWQVGCAHFIAS